MKLQFQKNLKDPHRSRRFSYLLQAESKGSHGEGLGGTLRNHPVEHGVRQHGAVEQGQAATHLPTFHAVRRRTDVVLCVVHSEDMPVVHLEFIMVLC